MSQETIRSIIVGIGGVTRSMLRSLAQKPWHEIAAVVDISQDALTRAADDYGLSESALYGDLDAALQMTDADVAIINTPSELHYSQARAALLAGLSPLVAKPMTTSTPILSRWSAWRRRTTCGCASGSRCANSAIIRWSRSSLPPASWAASSRSSSSTPSRATKPATSRDSSSRCCGR